MPNYIKTWMVPKSGRYEDGHVEFVDLDQIRFEAGPLRHPPFPEEVRRRLREIQETFVEVYPCTLEQTEDNFRRDLHPEREIAGWLRMARIYRQFTDGRNLDLEQKDDIFGLLLKTWNLGKEGILHELRLQKPRTLSHKRAKEIIEAWFGPDVEVN